LRRSPAILRNPCFSWDTTQPRRDADIEGFLARYNRLHIPEKDDIGDEFYDSVNGSLDAARTHDNKAKNVFASKVEASTEAIGQQLLRIAKETESERARGWFSRRRKEEGAVATLGATRQQLSLHRICNEVMPTRNGRPEG
jgi:hypothetical protein